MGYHKSLPGMGRVSLVGSGANPTPILLTTATTLTLDVKEDDVDLRGADLDIIDSFPSQRTVSGKITGADFSNSLLAAVTNGVAITAGRPLGYTHSAAIPATPFAITVTQSATFVKDLGVINLTDGKGMTRVASSPATGQYSVAAGVYTFASADQGDSVMIEYDATAASDGTTATVLAALSSTAAPKFGIHVYRTLAGKSWGIYIPAARIPGLSTSFKRDGWSEVSLDFKATLDASNKLFYTYGPE